MVAIHVTKGRDIMLVASILRTIPWFIVAVDWIRRMWVVMMDVGMLGLIYRGVLARTVAPGVLGQDIELAASTCRTGPWVCVAVAWSHSVRVVVMDLGMLGLMSV